MTANATPSAPPAREAPRRLTAAEEAADYVSRHRWWIMLGLITAAIREVVDTPITTGARPQRGGNRGAPQKEISWVSTGYILSNVVVLPMTAFSTERIGR